nr:hypothetical protein [Tanacetum cinerariifolium]
EGTGTIPGVLDVPTKESDEEISWKYSDEGDDDDDDKGNDDDDDDAQDDDDDDDQKDANKYDDDQEEGHNKDDQEEGSDAEQASNEEGRGVQMADVHMTQEFEDSHVTLTLAPTSVAPLPMSETTLTPSTIATTVNEQLEAEVLTRSSNSSKTSYAVAADLSEMKLKKILIEKMEGNKSIHRSNEQRNLYKALVEACESNKTIVDTYGDTITLKRRHVDDADKDEETSAGLDRGSKRRREGKKPESASAPKEKATRSAGKSTQGSES